jgi:hypothetical protein
VEFATPVTIDYDSAESCRPLSEVPWASEFPPIDPRWRTETVLGLAEAIRETKDFSRLPILADALEENGCENPFVLAHCRQCEIHHRECWLVSAILMSPKSELFEDRFLPTEDWRDFPIPELPETSTWHESHPCPRWLLVCLGLICSLSVIFFVLFVVLGYSTRP